MSNPLNLDSAYHVLCEEVDKICEVCYQYVIVATFGTEARLVEIAEGVALLGSSPEPYGWSVVVASGPAQKRKTVPFELEDMSFQPRVRGWEILDHAFATSTHHTMTEDFCFEVGGAVGNAPVDQFSGLSGLLEARLIMDVPTATSVPYGVQGRALSVGSVRWLRDRVLRAPGMLGHAIRLGNEVARLSGLHEPAEAARVRRAKEQDLLRSSLRDGLRRAVDLLPDGEVESLLREARVASVLES